MLQISRVLQCFNQDFLLKQVRSESAIKSGTKSLELITCPENIGMMLSENPHLFVALASTRQASKAQNVSQLYSCSSTNTTSSYCSTSSMKGFATSALIHCVWKNNDPYFIFSVDDDHRGSIYVASRSKAKSSSNSLDCIYLFHSKSISGTADIVGKMRVSNSIFPSSNRSNVMETEFVLYASHMKHSTENLRSPESLRKANGLPRKVSELFRSLLSSKHSPEKKLGKLIGDLNDADQEIDTEDGRVPNFELAAIIVKDHRYGCAKEQKCGGWGLKFLEKVKVDCADTSRITSSSFRNHDEGSSIDRKSSRNINVLIPAGVHGGPIARDGGPSSLTARWTSNGHCDCGGWDIGCPIKVLNNNPGILRSLLEVDQEEKCNSLELFLEGAKQGEPTLKLVNLMMPDTHVILYFQSSLSALQSFSIAVAFIHSQTQHLNQQS